MKASQFSDEQIVQILQQAERDEQAIGALCREHQIAEATFYRWRKKFGGMTQNEVQRLRELEKENSRLKRLLAERDLEVDALKEFLSKNVDDRRETPSRPVPGHAWALRTPRLPTASAPALDTALSGAAGSQCGIAHDHAATGPKTPQIWLSANLSIVTAARAEGEQETRSAALARCQIAGRASAPQAPPTHRAAATTG
jgi:putative transposase